MKIEYADTPVVYVAHPLGGDVDSNAAKARRWLRWLMDCEPYTAFCCPWLPFVDVGVPEEKRGPGAIDPDSLPAYRNRCLRDDLAIAALCHGIVLVGDRISPGMRMEIEACEGRAGFVSDLTSLKESVWVNNVPGRSPIAFGRSMWKGQR